MKTILLFKGSNKSSNFVSCFKNSFTKKRKSKEEKYLNALNLDDYYFINIEKTNLKKFSSKLEHEKLLFWIPDNDKEFVDLINDYFVNNDIQINKYPGEKTHYSNNMSYKYIYDYYIAKILEESDKETVYFIDYKNYVIEDISIPKIVIENSYKQFEHIDGIYVQEYGLGYLSKEKANYVLDKKIKNELELSETMIQYYTKQRNKFQNIVKDRKISIDDIEK